MDTLVSLIFITRLTFPQNSRSLTTTKLAKLAGAQAKVLFERLTEGCMGIVARSQSHLRNIHGAHAQFAPRAFHAHTQDIAGNALAFTGFENAMKVWHRETSHCRQHVPAERFVDMLADILLDIVHAFGIALKAVCVS